MSSKAERSELNHLRQIRDSWAQEHSRRIEETNRANANEKQALKRFQEADEAYKKALKGNGR